MKVRNPHFEYGALLVCPAGLLVLVLYWRSVVRSIACAYSCLVSTSRRQFLRDARGSLRVDGPP